jgi:hypothetical protein
MPEGSKCFGRHATRIAINRSVAAENSGHVSGTVKHPQYECAVVERLEDDQVISVCANPCRVAQVWTRHVMMWSLSNLLAVLPYLANERDSAPLAGVECGATKEACAAALLLWSSIAFVGRAVTSVNSIAIVMQSLASFT